MQWFCASRNPLKIQVSCAPHSVLVVTLYENESGADEDQVIRYLVSNFKFVILSELSRRTKSKDPLSDDVTRGDKDFFYRTLQCRNSKLEPNTCFPYRSTLNKSLTVSRRRITFTEFPSTNTSAGLGRVL